MRMWTLEDVTATARAYPNSFFIPSEDERTGLRPKQMIRLHFVLESPRPADPRAERMWVEVADRLATAGGVRYRGYLKNQPAHIAGLSVGDLIDFGPEHVARIILPADHPDALDIGEHKAMVSARVLDPGAGVRWAYREKADREEDSGWRLFAGGESVEWLNDVRNVRLCDVYWLVDRDPTLREIFRAEVGAAFERMTFTEPWRRVRDWAGPEE